MVISGKMKSREGTVVDADDLMQEMVDSAKAIAKDLGKLDGFSEKDKNDIIVEIEKDFENGLKGILLLPNNSRFGVFTAYKYYFSLLKKLKRTPSEFIISTRIRIPNYVKMGLLAESYINYHLNTLK